MKPTISLDGQMLIAMPGMSDPRFDRSVIYVCAHSANGAMGIIVNKAAPMLSFGDLVARLDIALKKTASASPRTSCAWGAIRRAGGAGRGFVLHTSDYFSADTSLPVSERIALTASLDILRAWRRARGRSGRCWRSAIPAGRRASSRMKSSAMAG
jgi:putative transcriptional regulator